ncbi:hypothetical protein EJB05_42716, partial [Eragrostis curvula]
MRCGGGRDDAETAADGVVAQENEGKNWWLRSVQMEMQCEGKNWMGGRRFIAPKPCPTPILVCCGELTLNGRRFHI